MDFSAVVENTRKRIALIFVFKDEAIISQGSGFVFLKNGILVTCNHVIKDAHDDILIRFPDMKEGKFIKAEVVIQDKEHDLALLKFKEDKDNSDRSPLIKGEEKDIKEGIPVLFSGYPLNISSLTTHQGILSSITKDATGVITYLIDGTVNPGNSGCPLLNKEGGVIGVINATRREEDTLITRVEEMGIGAISLHGIDMVSIYQALIKNLQLGMGYAVPCSYIPTHV